MVPEERLRFLRHASEQYLTDAQFFAHFFRHVMGRLHTSQIFILRVMAGGLRRWQVNKSVGFLPNGTTHLRGDGCSMR